VSAHDPLRLLEAALQREQKKVALVQEVSRALSTMGDLDSLLRLIMEKVTELMEADRSTLFLMTEDGSQLWSKVIQGSEVAEIRIGVGEGIAGGGAPPGEHHAELNVTGPHYEELIRSEAFLRAADFDGVVAGIERALEDPNEFAAERRRVAREVVGVVDGHAADRVVDAIVEVVA